MARLVRGARSPPPRRGEPNRPGVGPGVLPSAREHEPVVLLAELPRYPRRVRGGHSHARQRLLRPGTEREAQAAVPGARRFYASFRYQAQSWSRARRVVAKVEWHPGELYPRVGFIVTNLRRSAKRVVAFYNGRGTAEPVDQGREARGQVDAAVVHDLPRERRLSPAARAGLQPRQLPPHPGAAGRDRAVVPDHAAGEGRQDRGEGDLARSLPRFPDGRGGGAA